MPKRVKQSSRPMDINQAAFRQVEMATEDRETMSQTEKKKIASPKVTKSEISRVMAALGRKGGKKGGKRRLQTMTPEERSQIALKAAKARWSKPQD
jgi:phage gp16-like protein